MPNEATLVDDNGQTKSVPISDLKSGDLILVKPGEKVPADGLIKEGSSSLNESMLTGESVPVSKSEGAEEGPSTVVVRLKSRLKG